MTFDNFIKTYNGKGIDYDHEAGVQCVDSVKLYMNRVFELEPAAWGNAYNYWDSFYSLKDAQGEKLSDYFTRISNTPLFVPKKGDIMVWSTSLNGNYGHISVCNGKGNTTYFESYDQNWSGKNDALTKIRHNYNYVYGVLRPKDQTKLTGAKILDKKGYQLGINSGGLLAVKMLLLIAYKLKLTKYKVNKDGIFGNGTKLAVNELLKKWGYSQNGIAGSNFVKRLHTEIDKKIKAGGKLPVNSKSTEKVLDKDGYKKIGQKTDGLLATKMLLMIAYKLKFVNTKVNKDPVYGYGTRKCINALLKQWGYKQNNIAGVNFIKQLHTEIDERI